jgi:hypothetical protein
LQQSSKDSTTSGDSTTYLRSSRNNLREEEGKSQNSFKRPPKITRFEPRLLKTTKKLFPKDLLRKIKPSPLENDLVYEP